MKIHLVFLLLFFSIKGTAQQSKTLQFESYSLENKDVVKSFVQVNIDSNRLEIGIYTSNKKAAKILKWKSLNVDSISHSNNNEMYSIFCGPFEYRFETNKSEINGYEIYYDRTLRTFNHTIEFKIDDSNSNFSYAQNPFLIIKNPQFDYFVKGKINSVSFSQNGIPISDLEIRCDSCIIESKFGIANISEFSDYTVTLYLVNKKDETVYYTKQFVVKNTDSELPVTKKYFDLEFDGGSIYTQKRNTLIAGKTNFLYLANWECITTKFTIEIENGQNMGYRNGILSVKPNNDKKVKVIINEKETGYSIVSSEFIVV
jgi:hypothetical protein